MSWADLKAQNRMGREFFFSLWVAFYNHVPQKPWPGSRVRTSLHWQYLQAGVCGISSATQNPPTRSHGYVAWDTPGRNSWAMAPAFHPAVQTPVPFHRRPETFVRDTSQMLASPKITNPIRVHNFPLKLGCSEEGDKARWGGHGGRQSTGPTCQPSDPLPPARLVPEAVHLCLTESTDHSML